MKLIVCLYMFLVTYRPYEIWPDLAPLRIEFFLSLLLMIAWVFNVNRDVRFNGVLAAVLLFFTCVVCSWLCSPWADDGFATVYRWISYSLFFFLVATVRWSMDDLKLLLRCFLFAFFCYMSHSLIEFLNGRYAYRMGITRLIGIDESYADPNSFAASIVYALALLPALWTAGRPWHSRTLVLFILGEGVLCVLLTGSRAGFVSLIVLYGFWLWLSPNKLQMLSLGGVAALLLLMFLPEALVDRFLTIVTPEYGPASAQASAEGRLVGLLQGLTTWNDYFLTGCGPGCWKQATGLALESHNLYGQLCAEMGLFGVVSFVVLLVCGWRGLRRIQQHCRDGSLQAHTQFVACLARSLALLLILLLVNGMFGHNLFRYTWIWALGFLYMLQQHVGTNERAVCASAVPSEYGLATSSIS